MSDNLDQWQWADEDPFDRPLRASNRAGASGSFATSVEQGDLDGHFDFAVTQEKLGRWEAAANSFRRVLEIVPGHTRARIGLGACLLHLDEAEEALVCFDQCLFSDAEEERALFGKAVALQKLGRNEEANQAYRQLLEIDPDSLETLANLVALSVDRRDIAAVADYSRRLLRVDPRSKAALQGLATQAIWNGDRAAAVDYCTRIVEVDPLSFEGWCNLGFAQKRMGPVHPAFPYLEIKEA
jgi:Flp pilus assembly protein TadD